MVKDGMLERFNIREVYGMHNMPGIKPGEFAIRPGPIMAAADKFEIHLEGRGAHAAQPHMGIDPLVIGAQIVNALQSIAARNVDPLKSVVVSTTMFQTGSAFNIIPQRAYLCGTVRTLHPEVRDLAESRMRAIVEGVAKMHGAEAKLDYERGYPATINSPDETVFAVEAARGVAGASGVNPEVDACMGGEDFSFMLLERPGAYIFIGNGDSAGLHHPAYDFNDAIIPQGIQFWTNIAEARTRG
jgi:hippurate hydrolase